MPGESSNIVLSQGFRASCHQLFPGGHFDEFGATVIRQGFFCRIGDLHNVAPKPGICNIAEPGAQLVQRIEEITDQDATRMTRQRHFGR